MIWHQNVTKNSAWQRLMLQWIQRLAPQWIQTPTERVNPWESLTKYLNHTYMFDVHVSFFGGYEHVHSGRLTNNIAGWKMDESGAFEDLYLYFLHTIGVFRIAMLVYRSLKRYMSIPHRFFLLADCTWCFSSLGPLPPSLIIFEKFQQPFIVQQCWTGREV